MTLRIPPNTPTLDLSKVAQTALFDLTIKVVTPMVGGGALPGQPDKDMPVSAKSVRGHLRFWWRACFAPRYSDAAALFQAEAAIFGSTEMASAFDLIVETNKPGEETSYNKITDADMTGVLKYVLFPFQGTRDGPLTGGEPALREGVRFRLRIVAGRAKAAAGAREEIAAAVRAWILFGGVGARTRRGCGALQLEKSGSDFRLNEDASLAFTQGCCASGTCSYGVPLLSGAEIVCGAAGTEASEAWKRAAAVYRDFRQAPGFARNEGQARNRPGRSRWPEPDSIRDLKGKHWRDHPPEHTARPYFPRADLGLPIVFHFKDRDEPFGQKGGSLEPSTENATRMASPVIIKPLMLDGGQVRPMVLLLNAPHVWDKIAGGITLDGELIGSTELNDPGKSKKVPPMSDSNNAMTAREALLAYAKRTWPSALVKTIP